MTSLSLLLILSLYIAPKGPPASERKPFERSPIDWVDSKPDQDVFHDEKVPMYTNGSACTLTPRLDGMVHHIENIAFRGEVQRHVSFRLVL